MFELSQLYRHSASQFSATGNLIFSTHQDLIILRDPHTLAILATHKQPSPLIFKLSAQAPHPFIAHSTKSNLVNVFDPKQESAVATLQLVAPKAIDWSPLGDVILVWAHLRLSLYHLSRPTPTLVIQNPKLSYPFGFAFRPKDSLYFALVERHNGRDSIGIYDAVAWKLVRHFDLPNLNSDVADLKWSPCGRYLAIWESITEYILHIYTLDGRHLSTFAPYASITSPTAPSSNLGNSLSASTTAKPPPNSKSKGPLSESHSTTPAPIAHNASSSQEAQSRARTEKSTEGYVGLGIRKVEWSPDGEWLAIGGWDGKIRVLDRRAWVPVAELSCPAKISSGVVKVWREPTDWIEKSRGQGIVAFEKQQLPYNPPSVRADPLKVNPTMGISEMGWSRSGRWIACHCQTYPTAIWIYSFISLSTPLSNSTGASSDSRHSTAHLRPHLHSVLIYNSPIRSMGWKPQAPPATAPSDESAPFDASREESIAATGEAERATLFIATGESAFGIWTEPRLAPVSRGGEVQQRDEEVPAEGVAISIPTSTTFSLQNIKFSNDGKLILLIDKELFKIAYPAVV